MLISQVRSTTEAGPIEPAATEALWGFIGTLLTVVIVAAIAIFILRWLGFRLGWHLGWFKRSIT